MEILGYKIPLWVLLSANALIILNWYTGRKQRVIRAMGIKGPRGWPFVGNSLQVLWHGLLHCQRKWLAQYGKVHGFVMGAPLVVVADLDMLREIEIKQFIHFTNRQNVSAKIEKPLSSMITLLEDDEWKRVRNAITPAFSGGKLRRMAPQMNQCSRLLTDNLRKTCGQPFAVTEYMGAFSLDVIASTAFGLDIDSQKDPNDPFIKHSKTAFSPKIRNPALLLALLVPGLLPILKKFFDLRFIPKDTVDFFCGILNRAMEARDETDRKRTDFLQLMLNAHLDEEAGVPRSQKALSDEEVLAQGFIFFAAGYSTVMANLSFTLYLLAMNPEAQDRALEEIKSITEDEDPDYDALHKMTYLENVIQESLRIYPPAVAINRLCNSDCIVGGYHFQAGTSVLVPIQELHMDPEVWPDPEKFDPDRFLPEVKAQRSQFSWQPFGLGPRHCIGMRLALMEVKVALVHLLKAFRLKTCKKTSIPIKREKFSGAPVDVYLELEERV